MNAKYRESTRMDAARILLMHLMDSLQRLKNTELALRVYGNQKKFPPQDCNDTHLEVPFKKGNLDLIKNKIKTLEPKGTTPIAGSLIAAIEDFPQDPALNIVILITDGIEACDGDACDAARILLLNGIVLKPFIIGIGLSEADKDKLACVGDVFDLDSPETLGNILNILVRRTLNETTCQVNLLDNNNKALHTDINMSFINMKTKTISYNFVHKLNELNVPDTLVLKPSITYRLVVHTIPELVKDSIKLALGRHNIISIGVPIGSLNIKKNPIEISNSTSIQTNCVIRNKQGKIVNVQALNTSQKYLEGIYDVEILTQPPVLKKAVSIISGGTTNLDIPQSGTFKLNLSTIFYGTLFKMENSEMVRVCGISKEKKEFTLQLQPGVYKVVLRPENTKKAKDTVIYSFEIHSKEITSLRL
jgi:Ca-activated chloride channel family protein